VDVLEPDPAPRVDVWDLRYDHDDRVRLL